MTRPIQLVTKEIISYLCHIEQKAPRKQFALYEAKHVILPNTTIPLATVNDEAKRMLEFVGLRNYQTDIRFEVLDSNVGGNISLNNTMEPIVHICISSTYRNNWNATLAVLAHEICHKFLMVNGLYCSLDVNVNETYVDLATMYVGFGELMLNGCYTQVGSVSYQLGYLTMDTYKVAYRIVCNVLGNMSIDRLTGIDAIADSAINLWKVNDNKRELLKECFVDKSRQLSELYRNLGVMEQLVNQCKEGLASNYNTLDRMFFSDLREVDGGYADKMAAFATFYKATFSHDDDSLFEELNEVINEALYKMYILYQQHGCAELKQESVTCPSCGHVGKSVLSKPGIVKCPKCHRTFYWDASQWNCTQYQRMVETKQKEERIRFDQKVQKEVDERVRDIRKNAETEIEDFKKNEMSICKASIKKSMPRFYRWLASDYLE